MVGDPLSVFQIAFIKHCSRQGIRVKSLRVNEGREKRPVLSRFRYVSQVKVQEASKDSSGRQVETSVGKEQ